MRARPAIFPPATSRCRPARRRLRAFSLNEFLVVAAITLIVSLVFAYLTRDIVLRVRVAKVLDEHALLKRALQNYRVDWKDDPADDRQLDALLAPTAYLVSLPNDSFSRDPVHEPSYLYFRRPGGDVAWAIVSPGPDGRLDFRPMVAPPRVRPIFGDIVHASDAEWFHDDDVDPKVPAHVLAIAAPPRATPSRPEPRDNPNASHPAGPAFDDAAAFRRYLLGVTYDPTNGAMSAGDLITIPEW